MLDLPVILKFELIERIFPFLERDHEETVQIKRDQEKMHTRESVGKAQYCNFEDFILHPQLPPFATEPINHHVKDSFIDYHNAEQELLCEVILRNPFMTWDVQKITHDEEEIKKKNYEVEHSLIDFQKLIIGEKIRGIQEEKDYGVEFNDQHLAGLLYKEGDKYLDFYKLEAVQKLVEYQFIKTKAFLGLIMKFYLIGFLIPFILSITLETPLLLNLCYISCFMAQAFLFFFELVQFRQYGFFEYIKDFWNCIDLM